MFVGDGVNDSLVLAQADVGVAMCAQADITVQAASIILLKDNLEDVVNAIRISKATLRRIKLNFVWALCYNLVTIPLATGLFYPLRLDPMYAGLTMALSSCTVVASSLLLKRFKYKRLYSVAAGLEW
jgi:Cu+-exporting ATPase